MKKIIFSTMIASLLAFVGCQNEELVNENTNNGGEKVILTANIQGATDSRVVLTPDTENGDPIVRVAWNESGETFEVYGSSGVSSTFTQIAGTNQFEGTLPESADGKYEAYYGDLNSLDEQDGKLGQSTANDTPVLMSAMFDSSSPSITFEHVTAILKPTFKVNGTDINNTITKIVMGDVAFPDNGTPAYQKITIAPTSPAITLADVIYIHLPIMIDYNTGDTFTFTVTADGKEYIGSLTIPTGMSIVAGKLYTATIALTEVIPYVTFRAASTQTLDLEQTESQMLDEWGNFVYEDDEETIPVLVPNPYPGVHPDTGYIEYSVGDSDTWTKFTKDTDPVAFGGEKGDLRLRGISPNGTLQAQIVFGNNTTPVACSGDIRTLVDWENYATAVTSSAIFRGLFKDCSVLTSAPELPATTLAEHCYDSMFAGCTNLAAAPELPATTTLAPYCYKSMFYDCTSLTEAPELPATTLANQCYGMMFHGCTKLTEAPELKAAMLVEDCYNGMFAGCTSLTAAPALPATTLANNCYISMFARCSKLTSAPALPATTLTSSCYYNMFNGCTSLNSVTMLATDISAENCLTNWMYGVAATGTFTKAASLEQGTESGKIPTGESGIPSGWTVENY